MNVVLMGSRMDLVWPTTSPLRWSNQHFDVHARQKGERFDGFVQWSWNQSSKLYSESHENMQSKLFKFKNFSPVRNLEVVWDYEMTPTQDKGTEQRTFKCSSGSVFTICLNNCKHIASFSSRTYTQHVNGHVEEFWLCWMDLLIKSLFKFPNQPNSDFAIRGEYDQWASLRSSLSVNTLWVTGEDGCLYYGSGLSLFSRGASFPGKELCQSWHKIPSVNQAALNNELSRW
jgi:hypothetical protein